MGRLDRYVLRSFFSHWLVIATSLLGLFLVLDLLGRGDEIAESAALYGSVAGDVLRYSLYQLPFVAVQFAPYLTLIAALVTVMHLARAREWTPMLGAGRSAWRALLPVFLGAALLAVSASVVREVLLPRLAGPREALERHIFNQREWSMADLTARSSDGRLLLAARFRPFERDLDGLEVYGHGSGGSDQVLLADRGRWDGKGWVLRRGRLIESGRGERAVARLDDPEFRPADLLLSYFAHVHPLELSSSQLREVLARDPAHRQAATLLWAWRAEPFGHLVLLLLGLPFVFRFDRRSSMEGIGFGLLVCVLYFVAGILLRDLGGRGAVSPFLGGAGAVLLGCFAGLLGLRRM